VKKVVTSAQAMVESLIHHGVKHVFGIPGAHTYEFIDAMYERRDAIELIGTRHEQGLAYLAYGYAKSTGKVGVYNCVPGPGVLNTSAALCTAFAGNAPVLCLTSEIQSHEIGQGHGILHELPDQLAILRGLTKWADRIDHPTEVPAKMARAFTEMTTGRNRPVALECPWDTLSVKALVDFDLPAQPLPTQQPDPDLIAQAATLIAAARNPMITLGAGAQNSRTEVLELAQMLQAPVTAHRSGRGVVSDDSPYSLGFTAGNRIWPTADVLIAIGTRMELQFLRWKKLPPGLKIVRIDIDPQEMARRKADIAIVSDATLGTRALIQALAGKLSVRASRAAEFLAVTAGARKSIEAIQPQMAYLDVIRAVLPRDGFFVEEICQVGFAARLGFPVYEPRTYVNSGYQDNLGSGFPTALGVKFANPDKAVVSITGDGGFMFGMQELATAVRHKINLVTIVFNNQCFGNVLRDQKLMYGGRYLGDRLTNPDFIKLAESFGVAAYRARNPSELKTTLERALAANAPVLIEVPSEPDSEASPWPLLRPA
jgi:acetolactate synthase I/II/III large subunit